MSELHCIGCGGQLQNTDKDKPFYTPKPLDQDKDLYCMRCYKMRHYGEIIPSYLTKEDYHTMISTIPKGATLLKVIDIFDIEGSILPQITNIVQSDHLLIAANKKDLLPKSVKDGKIKHRLNKILADYGLKPKSIHFISAKKNQGIDDLLDVLDRENRDVYVVGAANTGKSTIINHMISAASAHKAEPITTFFAPGTTQDFIAIPFGKHTIYDTPGLIKQNHYFNILDQTTIKLLQPKKEVKPTAYQLQGGQTVFMGGLARVDFLKGLPSTFVFYTAQSLKIHRTKMINADQFYDQHRGELLTPSLDENTQFKVHQYPLNAQNKTDIVIPGIGHFSIQGSGIIRLYLPQAVKPYQRDALI